jgi:hypothetical protein
MRAEDRVSPRRKRRKVQKWRTAEDGIRLMTPPIGYGGSLSWLMCRSFDRFSKIRSRLCALPMSFVGIITTIRGGCYCLMLQHESILASLRSSPSHSVPCKMSNKGGRLIFS